MTAAPSVRFKPYPVYKDSGVEWLGEIPAHWEVKALKRLVSLRAGSAITAESIEEVGDFPVFGGNGIRGFTSSYTHEGEFPLIGRQGALCGCVNFASGRFWASEHAVVAAPQAEIHPYWLAHLLRAMSLNSYSESAAQPGLAVDTISALHVPAPGVSEQRAIAAFLDRETAKIDALMAKKERLIELLQEKRTALITRAVTKGLDSNVPMKNSGIEWLGEIPAEWGLKRLKRIVQFRGGGTPTKDNLEYWRGEIPWVSPKDMKVSMILETEDTITAQAVRESATKLIPAGAVLIVVRSGILVHSIPVALTGREVTLNQDLKALIPRAELVPEYLMYVVSGMQRKLLREWKKEGATVESLEIELVANTPTPLPAIPDQRAIATFLDRETAKIDALVAKIRDAIDRLKEFRTALISAAVTGKIDVRAA